jgi:hypothetical protein
LPAMILVHNFFFAFVSLQNIGLCSDRNRHFRMSIFFITNCQRTFFNSF